MNHQAPMSEIEEIQYEYWTNEDSCSGMNSSASSTGVLQVFLLSNDENYKSEYKTVAGAQCEEWMLASASADCIWILFYSFVILCLVKLIINFTFALFTLISPLGSNSFTFRHECDSEGLTENYSDLAIIEGSMVHRLRSPWHIIVIPMNILVSGSGTMLSSFKYFHIRASKEASTCHFATFLDGLLQLLLAPIIFGWIWSILFALAIYRRSNQAVVTGVWQWRTIINFC